MRLNEYQKKAMTTCMDSSRNFSYMFLNLVGEIGEFASKVAKFIRKDKADIESNILHLHKSSNGYESNNVTYVEEEDLKAECGDVLWQLSGLCSVMGWILEEIAQQNLDKLASRKDRGVIDGSGDNR